MSAVVDFDAETHTYRVDGQVWPSVTQILQPLTNLDGIPAHILEAARQLGTHVHEACDLSNRGVLDGSNLDPALSPYVLAWERFLDDVGATVVASEVLVTHPTLRYAGRLDDVLSMRGRAGFGIVDIKTSAAIPRSVGPQTAGYAAAYEQTTGVKPAWRAVVQLRANGTYKFQTLKDGSLDWSIFVSCLNIHKWRQKA